jgi:hypothetical protein
MIKHNYLAMKDPAGEDNFAPFCAENAVLRAIEQKPGASLAELAVHLGWTYGAEKRAHKMKVKRAIERLISAKLVREHRGSWRVEPKGQQELNALDMKQNGGRIA